MLKSKQLLVEIILIENTIAVELSNVKNDCHCVP